MADPMAGQATMRMLPVGLVDTRLPKGDFAVVPGGDMARCAVRSAQFVSRVYQHSRTTRSSTRWGRSASRLRLSNYSALRRTST